MERVRLEAARAGPMRAAKGGPHDNPLNWSIPMTDRLRIAIPLFPHLTVFDAIGPYEVLQRIPGSVSVRPWMVRELGRGSGEGGP